MARIGVPRETGPGALRELALDAIRESGARCLMVWKSRREDRVLVFEDLGSGFLPASGKGGFGEFRDRAVVLIGPHQSAYFYSDGRVDVEHHRGAPTGVTLAEGRQISFDDLAAETEAAQDLVAQAFQDLVRDEVLRGRGIVKWTPAHFEALSGIPTRVLQARDRLSLGPAAGAKPLSVTPYGAGTGAQLLHPQHPAHFVGFIERWSPARGYQDFVPAKDVLRDKRVSDLFGWGSADAWKAPGRLIPVDHPLAEAWAVSLLSQWRGGKTVDFAADLIGRVYGAPVADAVRQTAVFRACREEQRLDGIGALRIPAVLAGADVVTLEELFALQEGYDALMSRSDGARDHALGRLEDVLRVRVDVSVDLSTLAVGDEAFPYIASPQGGARLRHPHEFGVIAALLAVERHHLERKGLVWPRLMPAYTN